MTSDLPDLDSLIDERINQLIKKKFDDAIVQKSEDNQEQKAKMGQVVIQFLDKQVTKSKKKTGWFGQGKSSDSEDLKPWESWIINVKCLPIIKESGGENRGLEKSSGSTKDTHKRIYEQNVAISINSFENNMRKIIDIADSQKDYIPPITSLDSSPFPYSIDVERKAPENMNYTAGDDEGWGNYIKKMLD
ncbi:uncharacterized protein AC631_05395 [Debaryomyces fabryi]|uniref:Autophagy-related protein 101 n=1 Tax=Debaryomyces fabryi TaxID=58627 RepID=A0A0V1PS59_9ASCO|nr:uncharacterized protein AC631_05395 [Debaryomyces fabryi]KRZ98846.1 hypothetical protein AC631_05395 [Debaryomyces fabryi]CUM48641.1 unnamed protein product [Debaryomyces fabryi]